MPVFAQYTFDDTGSTVQDSALGDGAQNGAYLNGAAPLGGQAVLDGENDLVKINPDPSFQLDRGTLQINFTFNGATGSSDDGDHDGDDGDHDGDDGDHDGDDGDHDGDDGDHDGDDGDHDGGDGDHDGGDCNSGSGFPQTVLSRDSAGNTPGGYHIDILADGSIQIVHETGSGAETFGTPAGFISAGDQIDLSYSWDQGGTGGALVITNLTAGTSFNAPVPASLTMDQGGINQPWVLGASQDSSTPGRLNHIDQHFDGSVDLFTLSDSVDNCDFSDGYVDGTAGDDLIDTSYTGDPDGDRIDNNDAVLPGAAPNDDWVRAGAGDDTVLAGAGNDIVYGGDGNDLVNGGSGNDSLLGENGNDRLIGGAGSNTLSGGNGDDVFVGGAGADLFNGGAGQDNLDYSASGAAVNVNLTTSVLSGGDAANDSISGGIDGVIGSAFGDSLVGFDQQGTTPSDTFTNQFFGNGGNDTIEGRGGNDLIDGGADQDSLSGGAGDDTMDGGTGDDVIDGGAGDDSLLGGAGNDTITGGTGNDSVNGLDGDDVIDTSGGGGAYALPDRGYPGLFPADSDPFDDRDTVYGGTGNDHITTGDDNDWIEAGYGNDTVDGGLDDDTIEGRQGDDSIIGGEGSDLIDGGQGDDIIYGGLAPSFPDSLNIPDATDLRPDNGRDTITGGDGNDTIYGQDDADLIAGDRGHDFIDGGIDNDTITGDGGNDTIIGGDGVDSMSGGNDRDVFLGGNAGDFVDGNEGGDDYDTLDLHGVTGPFHINYDPTNAENGTVDFLDGDGNVTGTLTFQNIENVIPCFTPGTLIATPKGEVPVESLRVGDRVITRDNGMQEIRWVGQKAMTWRDLTLNPHLRPILVRRGSLGDGLPERDMMVSPNHRLLVANDRTALYFEEHEVLVAAKHLVGGKGVFEVDSIGTSYLHIMFDRHEVVLSNGAWTESFQPGDYTLKGMGNAQRNEIFELFPELQTEVGIESYTAARRTLKKHEARLLVR